MTDESSKKTVDSQKKSKKAADLPKKTIDATKPKDDGKEKATKAPAKAEETKDDEDGSKKWGCWTVLDPLSDVFIFHFNS